MVTIKEHNERYLEAMNYIMESRGMTMESFAKSLDITRTILSQVRGGKQNASIDVITKTVLAYPELNADYIIVGRGSMLIQEQGNHDSEAALEEAHKSLEEAMKEIKELREENSLLRAAFTKLQTG